MQIKEITYSEFDDYAKKHPLSNYAQTSKYALVMTEYGYTYDYIAMVNENNTIIAASMILTKKLTGNIKYGYAPKGFLINYYDSTILGNFLKLLTEHYQQKDYIFIKFNPEIIVGETDKSRKYIMTYNGNIRLIDELKSYNIKRRLELKEFDLMMPKYNAYINLKEFSINTITAPHRKKIKKCINKGMSLIVGGPKEIDTLYNFCKNKSSRPINYYRNLYNTFSKDNSVDLLYINIDFEKYLNYVREKYNKEEIMNSHWNEMLQNNPSERRYIKYKMESDKILEIYKQQIIYATDELKKNNNIIIAGALVIKNNNRISIIASGYDENYKHENPNHYMYYAIAERYKGNFNYLDIGGVSGRFDNTSEFKGLNDFKANFNAKIYEYVGEFDLICSDKIFKRLMKTSFIEDEFIKDR